MFRFAILTMGIVLSGCDPIARRAFPQIFIDDNLIECKEVIGKAEGEGVESVREFLSRCTENRSGLDLETTERMVWQVGTITGNRGLNPSEVTAEEAEEFIGRFGPHCE